MSICRGGPHYRWTVVVTYDGNHPVRFVDSCSIGLAAAGFRQPCAAKTISDTGQRRRITDQEPSKGQDHGNQIKTTTPG